MLMILNFSFSLSWNWIQNHFGDVIVTENKKKRDVENREFCVCLYVCMCGNLMAFQNYIVCILILLSRKKLHLNRIQWKWFEIISGSIKKFYLITAETNSCDYFSMEISVTRWLIHVSWPGSQKSLTFFDKKCKSETEQLIRVMQQFNSVCSGGHFTKFHS